MVIMELQSKEMEIRFKKSGVPEWVILHLQNMKL